MKTRYPAQLKSVGWRLWVTPFAFVVPVLAFAQGATLDVAIPPTEGSAAAGHTVEIRNPGTGFTRRAQTTAQGRAHFEAVPAAEGYGEFEGAKFVFTLGEASAPKCSLAPLAERGSA